MFSVILVNIANVLTIWTITRGLFEMLAVKRPPCKNRVPWVAAQARNVSTGSNTISSIDRKIWDVKDFSEKQKNQGGNSIDKKILLKNLLKILPRTHRTRAQKVL